MGICTAGTPSMEEGQAPVAATQALWPHQVRVLDLCDQAIASGERAMCVASATGTGKSLIAFEQMTRFAMSGKRVAVYCNRRLLFDQLSRGMHDEGITHGHRASGYKATLARDIQLCMAQTERNRVLEEESRALHDADIVIVDEAHLNANGAMLTILRQHLAEGATLIGYTATPTDIGHLYTHLIQGATPSEGRACGALLPARCHGPEIPDKVWIKRIPTGEENLHGKLRKQYVQMIFGRVVDTWRRLNPDGLPTILFAPGVAESRWFSKAMWSLGIKAAHIDAKGVLMDGEWYSGDIARTQLLDRFRDGEIEVMCNRFVLREGIDVPNIYHAILATKFGSETSYVQAVGRVLRYHDSLPGHVIVQDHGGSLLAYGSPNEDRHWILNQTSDEREYVRRRELQEGIRREPFTCPNCSALRYSGDVCPFCGFFYNKRTRRVLQRDGTLREYSGLMFRKPKPAGPDLKKLWLSCYWGAHRSGSRSFRQAFAWFSKQAWNKTKTMVQPDPSWPYMPTRIVDEVKRVADVPFDRLVQEK